MWRWFVDGLTAGQRLRRDALGIALAAHDHEDISSLLLIMEAQRIVAWIKTGDEFMQKDAKPV